MVLNGESGLDAFAERFNAATEYVDAIETLDVYRLQLTARLFLAELPQLKRSDRLR
jgi:hypothetical protein